MPLAAPTIVRLRAQVEVLRGLVASADPDLLQRRTAAGKWSARENVAHLARHQDVFLRRVEALLTEDRPALPRYRAEEDPDWPAWAGLSVEEALRRLSAGRERLVALVQPLDAAALARTAVHPVLGEMDLPRWLEFLLLHEAHHLYVVMRRVRGGE